MPHGTRNKQISPLKRTKTSDIQPKLNVACFVQSCLADAGFVVSSNYCLIGTRLRRSFLFLPPAGGKAVGASEKPEVEGDGDQGGEAVGDGLAQLDARQREQPGQEQDQRHEKDPLPAAGQKGGAAAAAQALEHLVHIGGIAQSRQDDAERAQGAGADADDLGVVPPEQHHQLRGKQGDDHGGGGGDGRPQQDGEAEGLPHPAGLFRPVIIAGHRLEALAHAHQKGADKQIDPRGDAHGGNGGVAKDGGMGVHHGRGQAGKALAEQGGRAHLDDGKIILRPAAEIAGMQPQGLLLPEEEAGQQRKADALADGGGDGRAGGAQLQGKHQNGVQDHIQHIAAGQADGGKDGPALALHGHIQNKGGAHDGGGGQNVAGVIAGIGQAGLRRAQKTHQRPEKAQAEDGQQKPHAEGQQKGGGNIAAGAFLILLSQLAGDHAACAHADAEAHRLDQRLDGKHHPHRRGGAGADAGDEVGVGDVVEGGDQHARHRGQRHGRHQPWDGRLGHAEVLLLLAELRHGDQTFFLMVAAAGLGFSSLVPRPPRGLAPLCKGSWQGRRP